MKNSLLLFTILALLITGCSEDGNPGRSGEEVTKISPVELVKAGFLPVDASVTVGDALDRYRYFGEINWKSFEDPQGRVIVEFSGTFEYEEFEEIEVDGVLVTSGPAGDRKKTPDDEEMIFVARFVVTKETFELKSVGYLYMGFDEDGAPVKTGETFEEDISENLTTLKYIYDDQPEPVSWMLLVNKPL